MGSVENECAVLPKEHISEEAIYVDDNRSFANAVDVSLNATYTGTFYYPGQTYSYHYNLIESGYYIALAANSHNIEVSYYGSNDDGATTSFIRSHAGSSLDANFGYEYGNYFDKTIYKDIYIAVSDRYYSSGSTPFVFTFCEFEKHNTSNFQAMKYDIASGFYSYVVDVYGSYGGSVTNGYNPNGSSFISLPYATSGTTIHLTSSNGYNTTSTFPYTAVGSFRFPFPGNIGFSTAFLFGRKYAMTNAHNVMTCTHIRQLTSTPYIRFGQRSDLINDCAAEANIKSIYFNETLSHPDASMAIDDWAILESDDYYGDNLGYLRVMCSSQLSFSSSNLLANISYRNGFPNQLIDYGNYITSDSYWCWSNATTGFGASGSPMVSYANGYVIGIVRASTTTGTQSVLFRPSLFSFCQGLIGGILS